MFTTVSIPILKRYISFDPAAREDLVEYLFEVDCIDEIMCLYEDICGDNAFHSRSGKSRQALEMELCELIAKHPEKCTKLKKSPVSTLRDMVEKYKDTETGQVG